MSKPKWTSWPWRVVQPSYRHDLGCMNGNVFSIDAPGWEALAIVAVGAYRSEGRANAHLIAAAPELYQALQSLRNEASGFLAMASVDAHGQTNLNCLQRRIDEADAVLVKAGEDR